MLILCLQLTSSVQRHTVELLNVVVYTACNLRVDLQLSFKGFNILHIMYM